MLLSSEQINESKKQELVKQCYNVIGCMHSTYKELSAGLPEPVFQESLLIALHEAGFTQAVREYHHYPCFRGKQLTSHIQIDILVPNDKGNIVIECKSISKLGDKERLQLFGYLRATEFPIGILVNFGSYPKAEIERYYYDCQTNTIQAF